MSTSKKEPSRLAAIALIFGAILGGTPPSTLADAMRRARRVYDRALEREQRRTREQREREERGR